MERHDKPQDDPEDRENKKLEVRATDYCTLEWKEPFQLLFVDQGEADLDRNLQEHQSEHHSVDQPVDVATHDVRAADNDFVLSVARTVVPL